MKIIGCLATMPGREKALDRMLDSIDGQFDEILVYDNGSAEVDLTDNGKFIGLERFKEPVYYFTLDDDLLYPNDYVQRSCLEIEKRDCIVAYHGRELRGLDRSYYRGHVAHNFKQTVTYKGQILVPGTGVTAFRTDYFNPVGLHKHELKRMSDLIFALEAAKQGKRIEMIPHHKGYIEQLPVDPKTAIYNTESKNEAKQIQLANEIFNLVK